MKEEEATRLVSNHPHWHHRFEIFPGVVTPGSYDPNSILRNMELPEVLNGLKALDIGASDGFFSSELHRRGAEVTAIDYRPKIFSGFSVMEKIKGIEIIHKCMNIYDIDTSLGSFDLLLFLGVIYHLPDIMYSLWKV